MNSVIIIQEAIVASATAQILPSAPINYKITVKAASGNSDDIVFGNSSSVTADTGYPLSAGDSIEFDISLGNTNQLYALGTEGDKFYVIGS